MRLQPGEDRADAVGAALDAVRKIIDDADNAVYSPSFPGSGAAHSVTVRDRNALTKALTGYPQARAKLWAAIDTASKASPSASESQLLSDARNELGAHDRAFQGFKRLSGS